MSKESVSAVPAKGLSGSTLKMIAIVTMFIDHIGAAILENSDFLNAVFMKNPELYNLALTVDIILRLIGRVAFPIFCFLLVEGFLHTRNVKKYALRLGIFCLISELPFNYAFSGRLLYSQHQNVFFTLLLGLLVLIGLERFKEKSLQNNLLQAACIIAGFVAATVLRTDYAGFGICVIVLFYLFRSRPALRDITAMIALVAASLLEVTGVFALPAIHMYNGKKGLSMKYFFYLFYPVHLLLLCGIRELLIYIL